MKNLMSSTSILNEYFFYIVYCENVYEITKKERKKE